MNVTSLSLKERIGQLVWPRLGSNMQPPVLADEGVEHVLELVNDQAVGGLIVFNGRGSSTAKNLRRIQEESAIPLLIASDIERGMGQQFGGLTLFPHAQAFSMLKDDAGEAVATFARITAVEAAETGVHLAFAPVADVDLCDANPIIATRAFSGDPEQAAELVEIYVRAAESAGLLTTAKHFPGHGRTVTDSHDEVPVVDESRAVLDKSDLLPFRSAIDAGVSCIMTSHVAFPQLDSNNLPATRSPAILKELLRQEIGFEGVVVSDSLLMEGAKDEGYSPAEQASNLLKAGVDVLLDPVEPGEICEGLRTAVDQGQLSEDIVNTAATRVLKLKKKAGLFTGGSHRQGALPSERHRATARKIARRAVVANRSMERLSPPVRISLIYYLPTPSAAYSDGLPLLKALKKGGVSLQPVVVKPDVSVMPEVPPPTSEAFVLVVVAGGPAAWRASHLSRLQERLLGQLIKNERVIVAALGPKSLLKQLPENVPSICTFSDVPDSHEALVSCLYQSTLDPGDARVSF